MNIKVWSIRHFLFRYQSPVSLYHALLNHTLFHLQDLADLLNIRIAADDLKAVHAMEQAGFLLMGSKITLKVGLEENISGKTNGVRVTFSEPEDLPAIEELSTLFHPYNQYAYDPRLTPRQVGELFRQVVRLNSQQEDTEILTVKSTNNKLLGFISYKCSTALSRFTDKPLASLDFIVVHPDARGYRIGDLINRHAILRLRERGVETIMLRTLASNYTAISTLDSIGMQITSSDLVFHKWL